MPEVQLRGGEVDGLALRYLAEGHGPAVILVHGLGGFAESWRHNVPPLAARTAVHALDLPGFGRSAKPRTAYGLPFFARALHGFVETLGLGQVSLVGHSLGGAVCVAYALAYPARVDRLALLGAIVPGFPFRTSALARLALWPGLGELLALCGCAPVYRAALARCFHRAAPAEVDFLVREHYAERTTGAAKAAWLATVRGLQRELDEHREDYRRALATLELPVLLVHGLQDRAVPPRHCAAAADGLRRAAVRWVDECGHFPQIEHASSVNGWLAEFLAGRPAAR
ncbi:MAG TPA: alpha/beta fold hydrolase [Methylomirabilota bacterium]|nr:alpha/beta fold hydrolase [Methylomirabilota bacterium]